MYCPHQYLLINPKIRYNRLTQKSCDAHSNAHKYAHFNAHKSNKPNKNLQRSL